jgi:hypothetical protein
MIAGNFDAAEKVLNKHVSNTGSTHVLFDHVLLKFHRTPIALLPPTPDYILH